MRRKSKFFASCTLALLASMALQGCATKAPPALVRSDGEVPSAWAGKAPEGTTPLAQWWRVFGDERLVQLVEAAQEANTDVLTAQANLRQARALRDAAAAAVGPTLALSTSAQHKQPASAGGGALYDLSFDAAWEPDLFGAKRHETAAGEAQARASAGTLGATLVSVAAETAATYLQMRGAQVRIGLARDNLASQQQTLQIAQWRERAGIGSSLDVAQARSAVEQTRAQLPALQSSIEQSQHALGVLVGHPPAALQALLDAPSPLPLPSGSVVVAIPAQTLLQRPDVFAAQRLFEAAAERVAQADAARRPTVQLRATLAWSAATLGSLGGTEAARTLLASVGHTLYDGGRLNARLAAQQAAFDAAQESYRASVLVALQEVEDALSALTASRERLAALKAAAEAAGDAALLASHRYASGLIDFQVVLETQRTLLGVQDAVASVQTDLATGHVRLYKALGGGWTSEDVDKEKAP